MSAIHYVAHSLELLARFVEYRPRAILLVNHPASRYRLAFRGSDDFEFNVDNFPPAYRVGRCANLLFLQT